MAKNSISGRVPPKASRGRSAVVPQRRSPWPFVAAIVALLVLIGIAVLVLRTPTSTSTASTLGANDRAVEPYASDTTKGRNHIDGKPGNYNSNPPAGGDHWGTTATWGVQIQAPPDEILVHNLEHGGVIIWYDPAKTDQATITKLTTLTRSLQNIDHRVLLVPRPKGIENGKPFATTSWGRIMTLDTYDEAAIKAFFQAHVLKGPECQAGQCPE